jgi:murein DD-endopeptidase MepM/ murein hydrolase activator NlpD
VTSFRKRRNLAIGAAVVCMLTVTVHDLPASAATMKEEAFAAASQKLAVPQNTFSPVATREAFIVTEYTPVQWPVSPKSEVSSGFGYRVSPCWGCSSDHQGIDLTPGYGAAIHVVADGVVIESSGEGGLGQHLVIEHRIDGQVVQTIYGHMIYGSQTVQVGDTVERGEIIGDVGSTGASTGPHLHFEVRPGGGEAVEPLTWLKKFVTEEWAG